MFDEPIRSPKRIGKSLMFPKEFRGPVAYSRRHHVITIWPRGTDHILFIGAGAFHVTKPSDLIPELQGRFPIRVELDALEEEDFVRILTEPENSLARQYKALLETDGVRLEFTPDGIREIAKMAFTVNQLSENIGARRLHTVMEKLLEDELFEAPDGVQGEVIVDRQYVQDRLKGLVSDTDLTRYIL